MPKIDNTDYLATRKTLVKALHTAKTVPLLAVALITSGKHNVTSAKAGVNLALRMIGQDGDWSDSDPVYSKCVRTTEAALAGKDITHGVRPTKAE